MFSNSGVWGLAPSGVRGSAPRSKNGHFLAQMHVFKAILRTVFKAIFNALFERQPRKTTTIRVSCAIFCAFSLPLFSRSRSAWAARATKPLCAGHLLPRRCCPASAMKPLPAAGCWGAHRHRCCPPWQRQHAFALARWPLKTRQRQQQTTLARSRRARVEGAPARRAGKGVWQGKGVWDKAKGL